ncbi:MAG: Holliday junction resolvase [Candidatus Poseidoniales archaeon]|nr:MAG: Holliday junction resolvase [Candidatus Poseidoniales archaeon]
MGSLYERELRAVLAGEPDGVRAVTRSCNPSEKARAMQVIRRPFLVVRAAGSGVGGAGDLLAIRGDVSFPIEVKANKERRIYLSGRTWEQYEELKRAGEACGLLPIYAYRLKGVRGDSWRILRVETTSLQGRLAVIANRIPALPLTRNSRPYLDWEAGLPLHRFLSLLCRDEESYEATATSLRARNNAWLEREERSRAEAEEEAVAVPKELAPAEEWVRRFRRN